jgi:hypothetical protein
MKKLLHILLICFCFTCKAQLSQLRLSIYDSSDEDSLCNKLVIFSENDTVYNENFSSSYDNTWDSLEAGTYKIHIYNCKYLNELNISKVVTLHPNKKTILYFDVSFSESQTNYVKLDSLVHSREEVLISITGFQNDWLKSSSTINSFIGVGSTSYLWNPLSKHFGILTGAGIGYSNYKISNDTTFTSFRLIKKRDERYHYVDIHFDLKCRFTIGNQKINRTFFPRFNLDIGVLYNFPLLFKHTTVYDNRKKIVNNGLHQFTDFRTYLNIGYTPVILFFEYRLSDFVISNYPEVLKYAIGIRFVGH